MRLKSKRAIISIGTAALISGALVFHSVFSAFGAGFDDTPQISGTDYYGTAGSIYSYDNGYDAYIADPTDAPAQAQVTVSGGDISSGTNSSFSQAPTVMKVVQPTAQYPSSMGDTSAPSMTGSSSTQTGSIMHYDKVGENVNNGYGIVFAGNRNTYLSVLSGVNQSTDPGYYAYVETPNFMPTATLTGIYVSGTATVFNITDIGIAADARFEGNVLVKDSSATDGWDMDNYWMNTPRPWANLVPPSTMKAGATVTLTVHAWDASWYTGHHYLYIYATAPDGTNYTITGQGTNMGQMTTEHGGNNATSGTVSSPKDPVFQDDQDSIQWTIPNTAPGGTYTFHVYLRDGQGRAAENFGATETAHISPYPAPDLTISAAPTTLQAGDTSILDVHVANLLNGDKIEVTQSSNVSTATITSNGTTTSDLQFSPGLTSSSYDLRPTANYSGSATITYTARLWRNGSVVAGPVSVNVQWINYYFTLNASQTSVDTGQGVTLTATTNRPFSSPTAIVIHDMSRKNTLSNSNVFFGPGGNPTATTSATDNNADTVNYQAAIVINGQTYYSNTVQVTWVSHTFTLAASQSTSEVGGSVQLTANTDYPIASGKAIYIRDVSNHYSLNGSNSWQGPTDVTPVSTDASDSQAETDSYQAVLQLSDGSYVYSNKVNVNWVQNYFTLKASASSVTAGTPVTLTANTNYTVTSARAIYIHDASGDNTLLPNGTNSWQGPDGSTTASTTATGNTTETVKYYAELQLPDGTYTQSNTVTVQYNQNTISNPPGPSITLAANTTSPPYGQQIQLSTGVQNVPTGGYIGIQDEGTNTIQNGSTWTPPETSGTDSYVAYVYDASGSIVATSNTVQVAWGVPSISLGVSTTTPGYGQQVQLTTSTQNIPSGGYVTITDNNTQQSYSGTSWTPPETSGSDSYVGYIRNSSGSIVATSNTVQVTWGQAATPSITLTATPTSPPSGSQTSLATSTSNMPPGGYVTIHDNNANSDYTGTSWNPPETGGTDSYVAYIRNSSGSIVATSNTVYVTWAANTHITLNITPTSQTFGQNVTATVTWTGGVPGDYIFIWNETPSNWWNYGAVAYVASIGYTNESGSATIQWTERGYSSTDSINPIQAQYAAVEEDAGPAPGNFVVSSNQQDVLWTPAFQGPSITAINEANGTSSSSLLTVPVGTQVGFNSYQDWLPDASYWNNNGGDPWFHQSMSSVQDNVWDVNNGSFLGTSGADDAGSSYAWIGTYSDNYGATASGTYGSVATQYDVMNNSSYTDPSESRTYSSPYIGHYQGRMSIGANYATGNSLTVIWDSPITLSLTANPTSPYVGSATTLTATISGSPDPGDYIEIYNQTTGSVVGDSAANATTYSINYTENYAQTDNFIAYVLNTADPGYHFADAGPVSVTWVYPPVSISLSASPTSLYIFNSSTITANVSGTEMSGDYIELYDATTSQVLCDSAVGATSIYYSLSESDPGTHTIEAYILNTGIPGYHRTDATPVDITWSYPSISVTITASPTNLYVGQDTQLVAQVSGAMQSSYTLEIEDVTTGQIVGKANAGATQLTAQYNSASAETDTFEGIVTYGTQPQPATSNQVQVTWYTTTITLLSDKSSLLTDQTATLTATAAQNVSGAHIEIWNLTNSTEVGYGPMTQLVQTYTETQPVTDTFQAWIVDDTTNMVLTKSNIISVSWGAIPITLQGATIYHTQHWDQNIQNWNADNPNNQRILNEFWAGEQLNFRVSASPVSDVQSVTATLNVQYDQYAPAGAPTTISVPLTYNPLDGEFEGHTDPNWSQYLEYLPDGTYQVVFYAKSTQGGSSVELADFTIAGKWTGYWQDTRVY